MRKFIICFSLLSFASCGGINRSITGTTGEAARHQASVEYGCPIDSVKLIDKTTHTGNATYVLNVCGTRRVYNQVGSTLQEKK